MESANARGLTHLKLKLDDAKQSQNHDPEARTQQYSGNCPPCSTVVSAWRFYRLRTIIAAQAGSVIICTGTTGGSRDCRTVHLAILVHFIDFVNTSKHRKYWLVGRGTALLNHLLVAGRGESRLDTRREVVCFWRNRFFAESIAGLGQSYSSSASTLHPRTIDSHGDHSKVVKRPSCDATSAMASR
jgi:hypothetical protein